MTRARSSSARGNIARIAVAGVLFGIPVVAVSIPAYAAPDLGGAPSVLPAPLPAEPATQAPAPPPPPPPPAPSTYEEEDWWGYGWTGDGGGGGGGG